MNITGGKIITYGYEAFDKSLFKDKQDNKEIKIIYSKK